MSGMCILGFGIKDECKKKDYKCYEKEREIEMTLQHTHKEIGFF